jgi:hypothetical protein
MNVFDRVLGWWRKDRRERAEEGTFLTPPERDVEEEDYQAHKDDEVVGEHLFQEGVDYERDSEPPRP